MKNLEILYLNFGKISPTILDSHCAVDNVKCCLLRILSKILRENLSWKFQSALMAIVACHTF
jgi:hypothetical protein